MAVFDEGCMGMYNAIIPDELLHPMGFFKERLSQSALFARMQKVSDADAQSIYDWLIARKFTFHFDTDFTQDQVLEQCKMYIAATQMAHESGCESLGIQYQLGLKDTCAASDLVEGMLNNSERPPVLDCNGQIIRNGEPYPHFNEVDECAGVDAVLTNRVHKALSQPPENTLHDVRWGDTVPDDEAAGFVWVFEISGAAPAAHHGGYEKSWGHRQPPMYFPAGGSGLSGIAKPGEIIWSRIFVDDGILKMHIGRGKVVALSENETKRRLDLTTKEWPIMHAKLHGVSKEQLLGNHKANHIQVAYANSAADADRCMWAKACTAHALGIQVVLCGVTQ
jgi:L-fucose isomerase-like protein